MERKVRILRFWFVALAVALLGLWEPALWFGVVPLFFWGGCPCCVSCTVCGPGYSARMQVDISGMGDQSGTGCSLWDGTYFLDAEGLGSTNCIWSLFPDLAVNCLGTDDVESVRVIVSVFLGTYTTEVWVQNCWVTSSVHSNEKFTYTHASQPDCSAFSSLSVPFASSGSNSCGGIFSPPCCDGSGATVTVTAIP